MSWIFLTLKFVGIVHLLDYRQVRLKVSGEIFWPKDFKKNAIAVIPFYFSDLAQITQLIDRKISS